MIFCLSFQNCRDNTGGDQCDVCANGYSGDATRGTQFDCSTGSAHEQTACRVSIISILDGLSYLALQSIL